MRQVPTGQGPADRREHGKAVRPSVMQPFNQRVELVTQEIHAGAFLLPGRLVASLAGVPGGRKLFEHLQLVRLVGVKLQTEFSQTDHLEPPVDNLQGGGLLGHEQHGLVQRQTLGDKVRDSLALACAGRTFEHEIASLGRCHHRCQLGGIGRKRTEIP